MKIVRAALTNLERFFASGISNDEQNEKSKENVHFHQIYFETI